MIHDLDKFYLKVYFMIYYTKYRFSAISHNLENRFLLFLLKELLSLSSSFIVTVRSPSSLKVMHKDVKMLRFSFENKMKNFLILNVFLFVSCHQNLDVKSM